MANKPSMTVEQAESILGPRGQLQVNADNVGMIRKWCTAKGLSGKYAAELAYGQLAYCYNGKKADGRYPADMDAGINWRKSIDPYKGKANADDDGAADEAVPVIVNTPVAPVAPRGGLEGAIEAIVVDVLARQSPTLDTDAILHIVRNELAGVAPREIIIKEAGHDDIKIVGHLPPWFERVVRLLKAKQNVCLVGPAGCGKTYIIAKIAEALNCFNGYTIVAGSAGTSEGDITGRLLPIGDNGAFEYVESDFVRCFRTGNALIALDEFDGFDRNMALRANMPLANGVMYIPHRLEGTRVEMGENVYFLATANTWGTAANPVYSAREGLDAATLDRFVFIQVEYDTKFEEQTAMAYGLTALECSKLWELRNKAREANLRRVISTRAFIKAAAMRSINDPWHIVMDTLTAGWSKDEKAKVGLAA